MSNQRKRKPRAKKSSPPNAGDGQTDEQIAASVQAAESVMARITAAPTRAGKVNALLDALDLIMRLTQVNAEGARLTRTRRIVFVTAVGHFIQAVGRPHLADEFHALASTLSDKNRGIDHKTLEKVSRKGGPKPNSSDVMRGRAYVAAAVDTLHRAGLHLKDIKRILDPRLELRPLLGKKNRGGEYALGEAAEAWREQFNGGTVENFEAVGAYENCRNIATSCTSPDDLVQHAERFLRLAVKKANDIERDSS
jgi:hypothetical protein